MSKDSVLPAVARERAGKGAARAVRREGRVPAVVYGDNKDPQMIALDPRDIWKGLEAGHFYNTIYTIKVDGGKDEKALPRDVQHHPVSDAPLHVDFMRLRKGSKINVNIPVVFDNEDASPGIEEGGLLQVVRDEVELLCPVDAIPEEIHVDLTGTQIGDTIRISAVKLPADVEPVIQDRDFVIASVVGALIEEPEEEEEGDEELEGETEEARAEAAEADEGESDEGDSEE